MAKAKVRRIVERDDVQHSRASSVRSQRDPFEASVGFDFEAVERAIDGDRPEDTDEAPTPRRSSKDGAQAPSPSDARTLFMMRELIAWLLYGEKADKIILKAANKRLLVTGYAVNPDLFDGKTLCDLAKENGFTKESLYRFARDFTRRFGIPVVGSAAETRRLNSLRKWPKGAEHGQN
jgi:hypothetical protein